MAYSEPNRWMKVVQNFVESISSLDAREDEHIKVALIDDGVDIAQFEGTIVYPGWPIEGPTSGKGLWCHSSGNHGTRMAKLIHKVCPRVKLYVAKLGDWETDDKWKSGVAEVSTAQTAADVSILLSHASNYMICI